ncbi:MAG: SCP2 sterol-binding domain-containing protein [Actinomycetota bacterium]
MAHAFLSEDWFDAIDALRDEYGERLPEVPVEAKVNVLVRKTPFSDDELQLHVDTTGGYPVLVREHVEQPDLSVTTEYAVAVDLFVQRDPQKIMQSFLEGKILVQGDITRVMALAQGADPSSIDPVAVEFAQAVTDLTELPTT